jgi:2-polyprenyl-6-methoxyphenol hydroxylase-like FAD-dependent oxidoreductase
MTQQPISIIGAGIGGLTLARCLLKYGIPAVLYERMPSTPRHSYGVTLHASSYRPLLKVLEIDEWTFKRRIAVDGAIGGSGKINPRALVRPGDIDADSFRAHREKLERLLREGLNFQWEHELEKVEKGPSGMSLHLKGGQKLDSSVIIGVDGPHSNTRKSLSPDTPLEVLPFVAFNGKRRVKKALWDSVYAPHMQDSTMIELKRGEVIMNIQVNEQMGDLVSISWVYSRPAHNASDPLYRPNRPVSGATDIPDEFYEEIGALKNLQQPFREVFDKEKLQMERVLSWLMRTVEVELEELQELAKKGVFFMGDAVHAEPIIGGEGANAAIRDGVSLAECISTNGMEGIPAWYDAQYPGWESGIRKSEKAIAEIHSDPKSSL